MEIQSQRERKRERELEIKRDRNTIGRKYRQSVDEEGVVKKEKGKDGEMERGRD